MRNICGILKICEICRDCMKHKTSMPSYRLLGEFCFNYVEGDFAYSFAPWTNHGIFMPTRINTAISTIRRFKVYNYTSF